VREVGNSEFGRGPETRGGQGEGGGGREGSDGYGKFHGGLLFSVPGFNTSRAPAGLQGQLIVNPRSWEASSWGNR
jgi:hypothetical protein